MITLAEDAPAVADDTLAASTPAPPEQGSDGDVVDRVLAAVDEQLQTAQLPTATYRVQFHQHCRFRDIEAVVPYLYTLGISDLYASPFLQARPGSTHGYDVVNHGAINLEIGTIEDLRSLRSALREHGMGLIGDVVPNHMSASPELNAWWQDVLENGPSSAFAAYFDIDWMPLKPDLAHRVLLPLLGDPFGKVLESGQLKVKYAEGAFWLAYFQHRLPIGPRTYSTILSQRLEELRQRLGDEHADVQEILSILTAIKNLPSRTETDTDRLAERRREKEVIKRRLHDLVARSREVENYITENLTHINGVEGDSRSFDTLDALLQDQSYRLAYWRVAADEINYRRFFDINELAAICTEQREVFIDSHRLLFSLLDEGTLTGLRIDHPDGLYDPRGYLVHLQEQHFLRLCKEAYRRFATPTDPMAGNDESWPRVEAGLLALWRSATEIPGSAWARPLYVVVEKILAHGESLPEDWPVHGTVGYEFLNAVNGLYVDPRGERPLSSRYTQFTGQSLDFEALAYECKRLIVRISMASELTVLGHRLDRISERNRWTRDFTLDSLTRALQEVIVGFRVYRSYVQPGRVLDRDQRCIEGAVNRAKRRNPAMDTSIFDFLHDVLLLRFHAHADVEERKAVENFTGKFQQLTGPIMAKAVEDTAFYRFNRLVSLNEVGGEPKRFGSTLDEFHALNLSRQQRLPYAMNASSTHDTKRSEDVRARINVLSEIPKEWREHLLRWKRWNHALKQDLEGVEAPSRNTEYLLYQTLIGTWPGAIPTGAARDQYTARLQEHALKVVREAKVHASWVNPNMPYEVATEQFVAGLLDPTRRRPFLNDLHTLATQVAEHGYWNSLSQLLVKIASPGVPDFYQGTELWNLTLVDPDNRHPVDFAAHRDILDGLLVEMAAAVGGVDAREAVTAWLNPLSDHQDESVERISTFLQHLVENRSDGRIKMFATMLALRLRRQRPDLFIDGTYEPLTIVGPHAEHLIAFARTHGDQTLVVLAPRLTVRLTGLGGPPPLGDVWKDTAVVLPKAVTRDRVHNVYSRRMVTTRPIPDGSQREVFVADALRDFSMALVLC